MEDSKKPVSAAAVSSGVWGQLWLGQEKLRVVAAPQDVPRRGRGAPERSLTSPKQLSADLGLAPQGHVQGVTVSVCLSLSAVLGWLCQGCVALLFPSQSGVPFGSGSCL